MPDEPTLLAEPPLATARGASARPAEPIGIGLSRRQLVVTVAAFTLALAAMIAVKGVFLSQDRYFLVLLVPALALGVGRRYVRDWLPFTVLVFAYEEARGLAYSVNEQVLGRGPFYTPMIDADKALFAGRVPTLRLQAWLFDGHLRYFDQALALLDRAHFIVPPTLLYLIWLERRDLFMRCAGALLIVSFAGALGFFVFPAAPPWLAAQHHLLGPVARIGVLQANDSPVSAGTSFLQAHLLRNEVAAVPSLHAAYSLLSVLFAYAWRRRVGLALIWYPPAMWFAVVYLGDHYVADLVVGVLFALGSWLLAGRLLRPGAPLARRLGSLEPPLTNARAFGGTP